MRVNQKRGCQRNYQNPENKKRAQFFVFIPKDYQTNQNKYDFNQTKLTCSGYIMNWVLVAGNEKKIKG